MPNTAIKRGFEILACVGVLSATASLAAKPQAIPDMAAVLRDQHVASASVALIRRGQVVSQAAWGMASPGNPATTATPYNLASLTKPLTAEIVLRLMSNRQLSLDEPMARYWSDPDLSGDPRRFKLTARLALSHRTGFPNWRGSKGLTFDHEPGTETAYSGEGFQYLARYAEHRTGTAFPVLAQQWLFGPALMRASGYVASQNATQPVASGYDSGGQALTSTTVSHYNAADFAHATAGDYARFMIDVRKDEHLASVIADERSRLQADQKADLCAGAKAASCPPWIGFGLGWQLLGFPGETTMMHTGKDDGAFTFAEINRRTGDGIVILTNSDNGWKLILPLLERTHADPALIGYLRAQIE